MEEKMNIESDGEESQDETNFPLYPKPIKFTEKVSFTGENIVFESPVIFKSSLICENKMIYDPEKNNVLINLNNRITKTESDLYQLDTDKFVLAKYHEKKMQELNKKIDETDKYVLNSVYEKNMQELNKKIEDLDNNDSKQVVLPDGIMDKKICKLMGDNDRLSQELHENMDDHSKTFAIMDKKILELNNKLIDIEKITSIENRILQLELKLNLMGKFN